MVTKFPKTLADVKRRREHVPISEETFFSMLDALPDDWHVWHSIRWHKDTERYSGEADFLIFHPNYGFVICEVKGGIIFVEDNVFHTENTLTGEIFKLHKSPFDQASNSMWHIVNFYRKLAQKDPHPEELLKKDAHNHWQFPLSFSYFVFFPDTDFKGHSRSIQYDSRHIFDETDLLDQKEWEKRKKSDKSPLERFLITLFDKYKEFRIHKTRVKEFFLNIIGSNISQILNLRKYYSIREEELEKVNLVQDFLLDALSNKKHCIFRGSAGSGKTYIAMKKAIRNFHEDINTLFLCFNTELRDSIKDYLSFKLNKPYKTIKQKVDVYSINQYLYHLINSLSYKSLRDSLLQELENFSYEKIVVELKKLLDTTLNRKKYDAIIIDEAQDLDVQLWDLIPQFLSDKEGSLYYVFYDEAQSLFVDGFSVDQFGLDPSNDLILLQRNLRNTIEIANWLKSYTSYGEYNEYSGINGFKITSKKFDTYEEALKTATLIIKNRFYKHNIKPNQITLLGYYRLENFVENSEIGNKCCYYKIEDNKISPSPFYIVHPNKIHNLPKILQKYKIEEDSYILYKTITSFKGLESDIVILLTDSLEDFKEQKPDLFENYLMQIYVGASRAKYKLYFFECKREN